jgi:hypothetical protein
MIKVMKTGLRILLILGFSLMISNVRAIETKAISDLDTTIVIINKATVNNNSTYLNLNSEKEHIFAAMPDTTIDIIIISRILFASNCEYRNQIIQKSAIPSNLLPTIASQSQKGYGSEIQIGLRGNDNKKFCI